MQGRFEETIGNQLGEDIGHANHQAQRSSCGPTLEGVHELSPQREDLVRVAKDHAAYLREDQIAAYTRKQLFPKRLFEGVDLPTDGWLRKVELATGACNAPFTRYDPKIMQMMIVKPFHTPITILRLLRWIKQKIPIC